MSGQQVRSLDWRQDCRHQNSSYETQWGKREDLPQLEFCFHINSVKFSRSNDLVGHISRTFTKFHVYFCVSRKDRASFVYFFPVMHGMLGCCVGFTNTDEDSGTDEN